MEVNGNLHDSAKNKQGAFCTRLQLIEGEQRHYRAHFAMNFNALGLVSLTATSADGRRLGVSVVQGGDLRMTDRMDAEVLDYYDEEVVRRIVEKYGYAEAEALSLFLGSETYRMLVNPAMAMWEFGPAGVFDMWESERIAGLPRRSAYLRTV